MSVFSYNFFVLWGLTLILYYTIASRCQWQLLVIASLVFYILSVDKIPAILLIVWISAFYGARYIEHNRNIKGKIVFYLIALVCVIALMIGRTTNVFALLGNSYFVLKAIGYVVDVNREDKCVRNAFQFLLFLIFFPTILEGPFNRVKDFVKNFENIITFNYENLTHGIQRFLWGTFKKIVVAERLGLFTNTVLNAPSAKGGRCVFLAIVAYAIQVYADFSGFMDMMVGVSLTFGIRLPENFKQPYFSKSIPEFWRRWHITLGQWFRDYVMFPFVLCVPIKKIRNKNRMLGNSVSKIIGTFLVWTLTGLWHGLNPNYFLWGLYYATIMNCFQIYNAFFPKENKDKGKVFQIVKDFGSILKTVLLVLIADSLICVQGLANIKVLWKEIIFNFNGGEKGNVLSMGITVKDIVILGIAIGLIFINSFYQEKGESLQLKLDKAPIAIRWGMYYLIFFSILIFGLYGSQYDVSQFIYMQF